MRVLLLNPPFDLPGSVRGHGGAQIPLNLCYLAAYARQEHPDICIQILDADAEGLSCSEVAQRAADYRPDIIGITATTCAFDSVVALTDELKRRLPESLVVLGGIHPTALPERTLCESRADLLVIGEGEVTFAEAIGEYQRRAVNWRKIAGLAYRLDRGGVRVNQPRPLIEDLDALPFPARDLVRNDLYCAAPTKRVSSGIGTMVCTSRGCPHDCSFCGSTCVWQRRLRARSAQSVVDEFEECANVYGVRSVNFTDEFFTADKRRVLEICRALRQRKLRVPWVCTARAEKLDRETLEAMRMAGCREISFGVESGNLDVLRGMGKRLDLNEALRVVRATQRAGIATHASYMLGYIGETARTIQETIRFAEKLNTSVAAFFVASPLPGTRFYQEALEQGGIRPDARWIDYSPLANTTPVFSPPGITYERLRYLHRRALRRYYLRPRYVLARLLSIRHWHDLTNLLAGLKLILRIK